MLIDAIALLLSDADARSSLVAVQLATAEHGINSHGYAAFVVDDGGERKRAFTTTECRNFLANLEYA